MKKYKYIKKGKKLIRNDLESILIYYDYFSPGIRLFRCVDFRLVRYFFHKILRLAIIIMYFFKIYKLKFKVVKLDENFIIRIIGEGKWSNQVTIKKSKKEYLIYKKVSNKEIYERERRFYLLYNNNKSKIKLPKHYFLKGNIIKIEFIMQKTMYKLIREGLISYKKAFRLFKKLCNEIDNLYNSQKRKKYIIHGDFGTPNIFINFKTNLFYIIDYSDSFSFYKVYDKYILYRTVLLSFNKIKFTENIDFNKKMNSIFFKKAKKKHPNIY